MGNEIEEKAPEKYVKITFTGWDGTASIENHGLRMHELAAASRMLWGYYDEDRKEKLREKGEKI
jgi:hypothetical protein